jgi:hypothetical protein
MKRVILSLIIMMVGLLTGANEDAERQLLLADSGFRKVHLVELDAGKTLWAKENIYCFDLHRLPNGNILYCDEQNNAHQKSFVREIASNGEVVWEYIAHGEVYSCLRLADGTTLVAECTNIRLVLVDADGRVVKTIPLTVDQQVGKNRKGRHGVVRWARQTATGTFLAAHLKDQCVREYDDTGKVLREIKLGWQVFGVVALPDRHILISGRGGLVEVDHDSKVVWELKPGDIPDVNIQWLTGIYAKKNGNIMACNWLGHGMEGQGSAIFEVTRNKQVVWILPPEISTKWVAALSDSRE